MKLSRPIFLAASPRLFPPERASGNTVTHGGCLAR